MSFSYRTLLLSLLSMTAGLTHADDSMQVNMLVYAQPEHSVSFELWRPASELQLAYPANLIDLAGTRTPRDERYSELGVSTSARMDRAAQRLHASEYRVLLQKSWSQPVPMSATQPAVLVQGGQAIGDHHELEGYLTIYYHENRLRLGTHLWLSSLAGTTPTPGAPTTPGISTTASTDVLPDSTGAEVSLKTDTPSIPLANVVALNDTRILNPGDLHLIDHPRFGVLIEIGSGDNAGETGADSVSEGTASSESEVNSSQQ